MGIGGYFNEMLRWRVRSPIPWGEIATAATVAAEHGRGHGLGQPRYFCYGVRPQCKDEHMQYIAVIHKDADSDYGVSFPDLPGVVTAGKDLDDARAMAEEALALHIEGLVEDGEAIPEASSLEAIMADPENRDGVAILVRVNP
jgi:predicted RNase H-like HicB family nuclease